MTPTPLTSPSVARPAPSGASPFPTPRLSTPRESLVRASDALWRVHDSSGQVLGHLRVVPDPRGPRYRAERLQPQARGFHLVGEFWHPDDAVQTLRHG